MDILPLVSADPTSRINLVEFLAGLVGSAFAGYLIGIIQRRREERRERRERLDKLRRHV